MSAFTLLGVLRAMGEEPVLEYKFAPHRKWKFDLALPARKVALEIEGGAWVGGRHVRASGYLKDCEKYNCATLMGWRVIRVSPQELGTGRAISLLDASVSALEARGGAISPEEAQVLFPCPSVARRANKTHRRRGIKSIAKKQKPGG